MTRKIGSFISLLILCSFSFSSFALNKDRIDYLLQKNKSEVSGPNCFNSVLYSLGIVDGVRYTSDSEFAQALNTFCEQIPVGEAVQAGDLGLVVDSDAQFLHAFIFLDSTRIFSKGGFYAFFPYELTNIQNLVMYGAVGSCPQCPNPILNYRCVQRVPLSELENKISKLEEAFQKYAFGKRVDFYPNREELKYLRSLELEVEKLKDEFSQNQASNDKLNLFIKSTLDSLEFNVKRWMAPDDDD